MRILVVGGYGFIGAHLCARLAADGHEVIGAGRKAAWARRRYPFVRWIDALFNEPAIACPPSLVVACRTSLSATAHVA